MGKNRTLPFGYRINDGEIVIDAPEAKVVRMVFDEYVRGVSYVEIAEMLQHTGVRYHANTPVWNKQMINRMLENSKYIGTGDYPRIIDDVVFERAAAMRKSKYVERIRKKAAVNLPMLPAQLCKPQPSMAVIRLQNEVTRALSRPVNDPEHVKKLIFDLAAERFRSCLVAQSPVNSNQGSGDIVAPFE